MNPVYFCIFLGFVMASFQPIKAQELHSFTALNHPFPSSFQLISNQNHRHQLSWSSPLGIPNLYAVNYRFWKASRAVHLQAHSNLEYFGLKPQIIYLKEISESLNLGFSLGLGFLMRMKETLLRTQTEHNFQFEWKKPEYWCRVIATNYAGLVFPDHPWVPNPGIVFQTAYQTDHLVFGIYLWSMNNNFGQGFFCQVRLPQNYSVQGVFSTESFDFSLGLSWTSPAFRWSFLLRRQVIWGYEPFTEISWR